jgi:hypothetical protein
MILDIEEGQRQLILMALAHLSIERPGFDWALNQIAVKMDNISKDRAILYDEFRELRSSNLLLDATDLRASMLLSRPI